MLSGEIKRRIKWKQIVLEIKRWRQKLILIKIFFFLPARFGFADAASVNGPEDFGFVKRKHFRRFGFPSFFFDDFPLHQFNENLQERNMRLQTFAFLRLRSWSTQFWERRREWNWMFNYFIDTKWTSEGGQQINLTSTLKVNSK